MGIWYVDVTTDRLNQLSKNSMTDYLGIQFTEIGPDYLKATMPVDHRTVQPMGLLHGGASAVLAESLGSVGASLCLDARQKICVGLELNINYLKAVRQGKVEGIARPIHIGRRTQVWEVKIYNDKQKLTAIGRVTLAVVEKKEVSD